MKSFRHLLTASALLYIPGALAQGFIPMYPPGYPVPYPQMAPMPQYQPYGYPPPPSYQRPPVAPPTGMFPGAMSWPMPVPPATLPPAPVAVPAAIAPPTPAPVPTQVTPPPPLQAPVAAPAPVAATAPAAAVTPAAPPPTTSSNPWLQNVPFSAFQLMMTPQPQPTRPYTMRRIVSQEEKKQLMQTMLPMMTGFMNMSMADAMNYFALKYKAKPGLSFDEVRESLLLRANMVNMKKVGENLMWKDFQAVLNDHDGPRIEVYSFCDIAVGRELLKISPEFVVFLPCRIAIMEDANKDIWVLMIDWNVDWVEGFKDRLKISDALWEGARDIRDRLDNMMQAAANGDL